MKYTHRLVWRKCSREIWLKAIFGLRWNWIISCILNWTELNWAMRDTSVRVSQKSNWSLSLRPSLPCGTGMEMLREYASQCACGKSFSVVKCFCENSLIASSWMARSSWLFVCLFVLCCGLCVCVCLPRYRNGKSNRYTAIWANCFTTNKMVFLLLLLK